MKNPTNYPYQIKGSDTTFYAEPPDSKNIGLDDYRARERQAILDFANNDARVMLCGGMSSMGKTRTAIWLEKDPRFSNHLIDLSIYSKNINKAVEASILTAELGRTIKPKILTIDEGTAIALKDELEETKLAIKELLQHFEKIIIFGAGPFGTADEQNEYMAKAFFSDTTKIQMNPFQFKPLNDRQTSEIIQAHYQYAYQTLLPENILNIITESYLEYFRIARLIQRTCDHVNQNPNQYFSWFNRLATEHFNYFSTKNAFQEQRKLFKKTMQTLTSDQDWQQLEQEMLNKKKENIRLRP